MLKTNLLVLPLSALAVLGAFGSACSGGGEEASPKSATEATTEASTEKPTEEPFAPEGSVPSEAVDRAIEREWARLRGIEGREGILAEKRLYSLFDEELIIRDFFQDRKGGFFLDVGCAWPEMANNSFYLEKHLGWKGIGIDALAEYGPAWKQKRPNSRFFSYLVTDRSNVEETFYRSPNTGLSSTSREMASGQAFGAGLTPEEVQVETVSLDDLLDREGVTKVDLLAMDIEGHEPKALAGFDIDRFRPELAVIENTLTNDGSDPVLQYFHEHGYELIEKYRKYDAVNRYFERKAP